MQNKQEKIIQEGHFKLASFEKRALAFTIDELLLSILLMIATWDMFADLKSFEDVNVLIESLTLHYIAMKFVYQALFIAYYGATVGKIIMKIKVINQYTGLKPKKVEAINRSTIRIISELLFYLGFIWAKFDKNSKTLHDYAVKTLVVYA